MAAAGAGSEQVVHPAEHTWCILAEHRGCILGEHAWYIFGEHQWYILVEHRWYIYVRLLTLVESLVQRVDAVVHVAGLLTPHVGCRSEEEFRRVNVEGTRILLSAALRAGVRRFVFTSTTSVYGCTSRTKDRAIWVTEELEPHPEDIYDITKIEAERLCREASGTDLSVVVLRMSRCFQEPDHLIAFYRLYRGVDQRDVAEGHWLAVTLPLEGSEILNLSAETPFEIGDVELLWTDPWRVIDERAPGVRETFLQKGWEMPQRIYRVYAIGKAKNVLGYRP